MLAHGSKTDSNIASSWLSNWVVKLIPTSSARQAVMERRTPMPNALAEKVVLSSILPRPMQILTLLVTVADCCVSHDLIELALRLREVLGWRCYFVLWPLQPSAESAQ